MFPFPISFCPESVRRRVLDLFPQGYVCYFGCAKTITSAWHNCFLSRKRLLHKLGTTVSCRGNGRYIGMKHWSVCFSWYLGLMTCHSFTSSPICCSAILLKQVVTLELSCFIQNRQEAGMSEASIFIYYINVLQLFDPSVTDVDVKIHNNVRFCKS